MHRNIAAAILGGFASAGAQAASIVTLSPNSAHPSQALSVSATGFGPSEAVDVYVDTVDTVLLVTSGTGTFSGPVTVPALAQPGLHYITAIGRHSGDAAQAKLTVSTPWLELGYGQGRHGVNPYENTLNADNAASLGLLWSFAGPGSGATPVVASGRVIASSLAGVQALNESNGAVLWSKLNTETFYASPCISFGGVYIGGTSGNFYDLNLSTGATVWSRSLDSTGQWYSSAVVVGNVVYVATYGGTVYALNKATGTTLWSFATTEPIDSSPAVANGILYVGTLVNKIYAINATTGAYIWNYTTGAGGMLDFAVETTPVVANGTVYFGSDDGYVYAIRADSGATLWYYNTGAPLSSAVVAYNSVFIGSGNTFYSLNAHTGAVQWSASTESAPNSPAVANGVVYFTSVGGSFYALAASYGGLLASGTLGGNYFGGPAISDGMIFLDTSSGSISALALLAGANALRHPTPKSLHPNYRLTITR